MINQITSAALKNNSPQQQRPSNVAPASDSSISTGASTSASQDTSFSAEYGLNITNDNVISAIDKALASDNATPIRNLNADDFTPESVAKGILNFVQNAISRAETRGQSASDLIKQANIGIENGFAQAKSILTSLNALSGQIAEGVQKTYDIIHQGMQKIETAQQKGETVNFDSQSATVTQLSQQTQSQSRSFELNITTLEGDNVKISVFQSQSNQQFDAIQTGNNANASFSQSQSRTVDRFEFSVAGTLDKSEVSAIEDLLAKAKALSEDFFNNDVSAGFEVGLSLGFNTQEIANVALQLSDNQTQTASRAYREINRFGTEGNRVSPSHLENLLKPAHDVMLGLRDSVEQAANTDLFQDNAKNPVEGLFNYFSRANADNAAQIQNFESLTGSSFESITRQLISSVS